MIVALTGASGNMGKETLKSLLECEEITTLRILVKQDKKSRKEARKAKRKYGARVEVIEGDVRRYEDCLALVRGAEYVYHLAAVIPPSRRSFYRRSRRHQLRWNGQYGSRDHRGRKHGENDPYLHRCFVRQSG